MSALGKALLADYIRVPGDRGEPLILTDFSTDNEISGVTPAAAADASGWTGPRDRAITLTWRGPSDRFQATQELALQPAICAAGITPMRCSARALGGNGTHLPLTGGLIWSLRDVDRAFGEYISQIGPPSWTGACWWLLGCSRRGTDGAPCGVR